MAWGRGWAVGRPARRTGERGAGRVRLGASNTARVGPPGRHRPWAGPEPLGGVSRAGVAREPACTKARLVVNRPKIALRPGRAPRLAEFTGDLDTAFGGALGGPQFAAVLWISVNTRGCASERY